MGPAQWVRHNGSGTPPRAARRVDGPDRDGIARSAVLAH
jgi:hypothetical protein